MPVTDVNEILDWLEDNELTDQPLVTIYRGSKKMVTRRRGIGNLAHSDPIREHPPPASLDELLKALNFFHLNSLLTPTCCLPDVWKKDAKTSMFLAVDLKKVSNAVLYWRSIIGFTAL